MAKRAILVLVSVLVFAGVCFARFERWPIKQRPAVTLAKAEEIGDKALLEKYKDYFCIRARFASLGDTDQAWELEYANSKGERKLVVIDCNGKAKLLEGIRNL